MDSDGGRWPFKAYWIDLAWGAFAVANLIGMVTFPTWETVPFHFIWVSLTVLYGFRVWRVKPTVWTLAAVMIATGSLIGLDVSRGYQPLDEITEVPLMAAMFVAMVWHARRRLAAMEEIEQVSEANARLLERERRFLQDASHELRTPITVALGQIELIERSADHQAMREDAAVAIDELLQLRRLSDRLLLLASAEHPQFLKRVLVDVDDIVAEAVRRWAATPRTWAQRGVAETLVEVDQERIELALDSLIENAVNHTGPGGRIEISARREGSHVSVVVADSGVGIAPEHLERIFERFGRADPGRSRTAGGVGLGLSIVKAIVEAHGGSVRVRSRVGEGSEFEIVLPFFGPALNGQPGSVSERALPAGDRRVSPR
jgi:signal transduction histidine kinase